MGRLKGADDQLNEWTKFFSVQFTRKSIKRANEKKDGFLVVGSIYSILTDDESKQVAKS